MRKNALLTIAFVVLSVFTAQAQDSRKVAFSLVVGDNLGGTAPMGLPEAIRSIDSYNPKFNPAAGIKATMMLSDKWGVGTGLMYETKGMKTSTTVRNYYMTINLHEPNDPAVVNTTKGYFTGKVQNSTRLGMLTLPVCAVWKPVENWTFNAGAYLSAVVSREFTGAASEGRIRENPYMPIIAVGQEDYDYSDHLNRFDFGFMLGASRRVWKKLSVEADVKMGCLNMYNKEKRFMDMNMYNIYLFLGLSYEL